jgi:MYXO-CTERM domain-containing protein
METRANRLGAAVLSVWVGATVSVVGVTAARAQQSSTLTSLGLHPNINTMEVVATVEGDQDGDSTLEVRYRPTTESFEVDGHRLLPIGGGTYVGALFYLRESTEHEVRVVLHDPDNASDQQLVELAVTRSGVAPSSQGVAFYVDAASGDDGNTGTQADPLGTIQEAVSRASPSDVVRVLPGTYYESVVFDHGGEPGEPILLVAEGPGGEGPGVVLSGADQALAEGGAVWNELYDGIYWTEFDGACTYLAAGGQRIYDYQSLADLEEENGNTGTPGALAGGFFVDQAASRLYLRLPDRSHPSDHDIYAGVREVGVLLDTVSHVHLRGLTIRHFSEVAVDVRHSSYCFVEQNTIRNVGAGVRVRRSESHANTIQDNVLQETSVYFWPWGSCKGETCEASAVSVTGGRDNVVRRNRIQGFFNGIYTGQWDTVDLAIARNVDVYENVIYQVGDDGLEPEGACVNHKFFENLVGEVHNGVSLAPIETGPTWLIRNLIVDFNAHALKLNNGPTGHMLVYHNTSAPHPDVDSAQPLAPTIPFGGFLARNNIWSSNRYVIEYIETSLAGVVDMDYDNLYTYNTDGGSRFVKWMDVRYGDLAELQASTDLEPHGLSIEPHYEDPAGGDYSPAQGSGLLDSGEVIAGINDRLYVNGGPDIGAFERGGIHPGPDDGGVSWPDGSIGPDATLTGDGGAGDGATSSDGGGQGSNDVGGCGCRAESRSHGGTRLPFMLLLVVLSTLGALFSRRRRAP